MSAFVHMELSTSDVAKAKKFYKSVLGWTYQEMPMPGGTYTLVMSESGPVGGMQKNPMPKAPNNWCGYAAVKSVSRTVTKVKKLGGKVIVPKTDLPGSGCLAVLTDPQGAAFGIWQAAPPAKPAKKAAKKAAKKRSAKVTKKAAKKVTKKASKKRTTKKAAKKATKRTTKKVTKRTTKKVAKKATKKVAKKATKKAAKKRTTKKVVKKATKKAAKKRTTKKVVKKVTKKAAKKRTAKKAPKKRLAKKK